jgi:hypothetical protein
VLKSERAVSRAISTAIDPYCRFLMFASRPLWSLAIRNADFIHGATATKGGRWFFANARWHVALNWSAKRSNSCCRTTKKSRDNFGQGSCRTCKAGV